MGLRKEYLKFITDNAVLVKNKVLELGNQIIKDGCGGHRKTGKELFSGMGCFHLSIDINGKDGAMMFDLEKRIPGFDNTFDVVINNGVSTDAGISNKKACYDNIYRMCAPGGVMIHILPEVGSGWCGADFVNKKFFKDLAKKQGSKIKTDEIIKGLHGNLFAVALIKNDKE